MTRGTGMRGFRVGGVGLQFYTGCSAGGGLQWEGDDSAKT